MRMTLVLAVAAALMAGAAGAADLPVKAATPLVTAGYPYSGNGFYAGIGAVGAVANSGVAGSNLFSAGAALDLTAGYQWSLNCATNGSCTNWAALQGSVQYTNLGTTTTCPTGVSCSINSKWGFELDGLFGFPLTNVLSVMPNLGTIFPALPALPAGVTAATSHPYLLVGLRADDVSGAYGLANGQVWTFQPAIGMGLRSQWTQGLAVDTSASCTFAGTGFTVGGVNANLGRDCRAAVRFLY